MHFLPIIAFMLFGASAVNAAMPDDSYIAGYAAGILKHQFQIDAPALIVRNGTITIPADKVSAGDRAKVVQILGLLAATPQQAQPDQRRDQVKQQRIGQTRHQAGRHP